MNTKRAPFFISFLLLFIISQSALAEEPQKAPALFPVQVATAEVTEDVVPTLVEIVGTLQAVERAALAAKITGMISNVPVVLGSRVNKGDLLVQISAQEISAQVNRAEAQFKQASRNLEREQKLLNKNASTSETVKSMRDQYAVTQAAYEEAKTMLSYTTITAPFSGVITEKKAHAGDLATPGAILLRMENDKKLQVHCAVPESLVLQIHPGDELEIRIPTAKITVKGEVAEVAPSADPVSRTAEVTINLDFDKKLRTGQFARVQLAGQNIKSLYIPQTALLPMGQMERVFVAEKNKAVLRLVRTGKKYGDKVEILSGLQAGESVITANNQMLVNGQPVTFSK